MAIGIYKITDTVKGQSYIGSSNNIAVRFKTHKAKLNKNTHPNIHLQRAWALHGVDNFIFEIIIECDLKELTVKEQYYMDLLKPEYNICPIARSSRGRPFTEETRAKYSRASMGQKRSLGYKMPKDIIKIKSAKLKGLHKTDEEKRIIGAKNKLYTRTQVHLDKLSENSTNKRKVLMIDLKNGEEIMEFNSITDARLYVNMASHASIQRCCMGTRKSAGGYNWEYKDEGIRILVKDERDAIVGEFDSFSEIAKTFNKSRSYIKRCFNEKISDYDNYIYEYKNAV